MSTASENTITMHDKHEATTAAMQTTSASSDKHQVTTAAMTTTITRFGRLSAALTDQHTKKVR